MTLDNIDKLIALSKEKKQLIDEMFNFTKTLKSEIKKEDMDNLNYILDKKDKLIDNINKIDVEFLTIFSQIKKDENIENIDQLDVEAYPNLKELKDLVTDISSVLVAISLLDEDNNKNMMKRIEETKMELKKVKEGQRAYKQYHKPIERSILIDEKK